MTEHPIKRFRGKNAQRSLSEAILKQRICIGNQSIAERLCKEGEVLPFDEGGELIREGSPGNDLFLILFGEVSILIKGTEVATRIAGDHVGEQALIDPSKPRTATVIAKTSVVVLKVGKVAFDSIAIDFPAIWKPLALVLSDRLEQRNRLVRPTNRELSIFIISSSESLTPATRASKLLSEHGLSCILWADGVFRAGDYAIESLDRALQGADFALAIASPDDVTISRRTKAFAPRDNVMFELGFFMGVLGRDRSILLESADAPLKLPSDLKGLTTVRYNKDGRAAGKTSLKDACGLVAETCKALGPR